MGWRIPLTAKRLERNRTLNPFGLCQAIGVLDRNNVLIAGVVYHNWDPDCQSIELSFAADTPKWLHPSLIRDLMGYVYDTLGCNRAMAVVEMTNAPSRTFVERFGFRREGVATDGFGPGKNAVIYRLLKREWQQTRWARASLRTSIAA
ncbi:hypothetical protein DJ017_19745 [Phenylobacterium soli]|uniref:N-acetyltransferase domain-containing protein n=1 Tax=Phenylobacterium soli TaxID=2170551 RepID=A0A328ACT2_9CAUL|nr:hypothetical protein DJ017_19745 [Phenylobacterium soli]